MYHLLQAKSLCSRILVGGGDVTSPSYICHSFQPKNCSARIPKDIVLETEVHSDGHLDQKHLEDMLNTTKWMLTWLMRTNTDVTPLRSGTAVKAVIYYVTDYVTKSSFKTHVMFDALHTVLDTERQQNIPNASRVNLVRMVNASLGNDYASPKWRRRSLDGIAFEVPQKLHEHHHMS